MTCSVEPGTFSGERICSFKTYDSQGNLRNTSVVSPEKEVIQNRCLRIYRRRAMDEEKSQIEVWNIRDLEKYVVPTENIDDFSVFFNFIK